MEVLGNWNIPAQVTRILFLPAHCGDSCSKYSGVSPPNCIRGVHFPAPLLFSSGMWLACTYETWVDATQQKLAMCCGVGVAILCSAITMRKLHSAAAAFSAATHSAGHTWAKSTARDRSNQTFKRKQSLKGPTGSQESDTIVTINKCCSKPWFWLVT